MALSAHLELVDRPQKQQIVSENPNLYDLFGPTSLKRWERLVSEGVLPTNQQLAEIVEANGGTPLPSWLTELVAKGLRGKLKQRPGRPKRSAISKIQLALALDRYSRVLRWLQKREQKCGLRGWPILRGQEWWQGPPHER